MTDFHGLYERYANHVHRFALFLCDDPALADDITSETFVRAWTSPGPIREETVKAYLFTIARNLYHDFLCRAHSSKSISCRTRRLRRKRSVSPECCTHFLLCSQLIPIRESKKALYNAPRSSCRSKRSCWLLLPRSALTHCPCPSVLRSVTGIRESTGCLCPANFR